jgi:hypothetical protein
VRRVGGPLAAGRSRAALLFVAALLALAAAWVHCNIYDPSLLLPADGGALAEAGDSGDGDGGDADSASDDAAAPPPDAAEAVCTTVNPPARPASDDPSDAGDQTFSVAMRSLDMGVRRNGSPPPLYGYDLDHVFTCCDASPESCEPPVAGGRHCDEPGGRDNSGGALISSFASIAGAAFNQDTITQSLEQGVYSLLMQVEHYNGQPNDNQVTVAIYASDGIEPAPDGGPRPAKWDGTDVWTLDERFVLGGIDATPVLPSHYDTNAYVADGVIVVSVNFPLYLGSASIPTLVVALSGGAITANVVPTTNPDGTPGYHLEAGQIVGRWRVAKLLGALTALTLGNSPICRGTPVYGNLKSQICQASDIATDPTRDNAGAACDALSVAFGFTADPARLGPVVPAMVLASACPDAGTDDCTQVP